VAKAVEQLGSGLTVGHAALGLHGEGVGSVRQQVHDGDTINVRADGNFGVRLLGVDAPEVSIPLPSESRFVLLSDGRWEAYLSDPFAAGLPDFDPPLEPGLVEHLRSRAGAGATANHHRHAEAAEDAFEAEILADMETLGLSKEDFRFFLAFAYEVMDRYGRFLCYINREQRDPRRPEPRPRSYNERLLAAGMVKPYFIWPNVDPFLREPSISAAVIPPRAARRVGGDNALGAAREAVRAARERGLGVFEAQDPLRLQPFEMRYLSRRRPPDRWVIDLGEDDDLLVAPQRYHEIPNPEDRLFVPEEYVPLFVEAGWRRAA
jgi:endonuclease YncB( thermonuclease family)